MPILRDVGVRLAEHEETLDETAGQEGAGAKRGEPAA